MSAASLFPARPQPAVPRTTPLTTPRVALADADADSHAAVGHAAEAGHSVFVPVLLLAAAVVAWSGFQTVQLVREHGQLAAARAAQQEQVDAATRVRANLDALAASTQRLANAGNANARAVVDGLRRRGVSINPNPAPLPAAAPAR